MSKKISEAYLANPRATFDGTEQVPINDGTTTPAAGLVSRIAAYVNSLLGTASTLAFDTDGTLAANSDTKIATQKAVKTYVAAAGGTGTVTHTGGALTANAVVLGAGTADTKVVAGITTDGTSKVTLGVAGTSVGAVVMNNATSGSVTIQPVTGALGSVTLSAPAKTATLATTSQTDEMMAGYIGTPSNKSYKFVVKAKHPGTITETTTVSESGTCTATFKINTTALGGTANSVSSTEQSQAQSSANAFSAGDYLVLTVSSNSTCVGLSFSLKYTRTLA